ncbi:DUF6114 domain-containing protein [Candidatus Marsarchaeota archaeon]|jgi:hypothetical protein|nr:DUF6114 domain-containing protein [Candidatus Marsarchaeota archaeon]MCL5092633.1 DUF6114 domain-containing protein [Candidatus Marsarchaeota archaeon]
MANKPTAAFVLLLIGGIFVLLEGLVMSAIGALATLIFSSGLGALTGIVGIITGIIMIVSAVMVNTTDKSKIKTWSIIGLIISIVSLLGGGGLIIGFLLGLIGGILGLTYKD